MTREEETGVMLPRAKERGSCQQLEGTLEGAGPGNTLIPAQ